MIRVRELLEQGADTLRRAAIDPPRREAALLLRTVLGMSESALLAHDLDQVDPEAAARFLAWIERRGRREPAAYLIGEREFWGRPFAVDSRVLVPRPETELLVELCLSLPLPAAARAIDVGTGSGCLALTLAAERPTWLVGAIDCSLGALAVATANARRLGLERRVHWSAGDLSSALQLAKVDLLVANLPYIDVDERHSLPAELAFEPPGALFAGHGGLAQIERLLIDARRLAPGSWLALEIGASQLEALMSVAASGPWRLIEVRRDLGGFERSVVLRRSPGRG